MHATTLLAFSLIALLAGSMPIQDQERAQGYYERRILGIPGDTKSLNSRVSSMISRRSPDEATQRFGPRPGPLAKSNALSTKSGNSGEEPSLADSSTTNSPPLVPVIKSETSGVESAVDDSSTTNPLQSITGTDEPTKLTRPVRLLPKPNLIKAGGDDRYPPHLICNWQNRVVDLMRLCLDLPLQVLPSHCPKPRNHQIQRNH